MRVLVGVKRVVDYVVKVRVNTAKTAIETKNVKMSMNPFCEIAVEEAVRLRESKTATEVIAVSVGPKQCQETLRGALAMGCDKAIHIQTDMRTDQDLEPLTVAKVLRAIVQQEDVDLVIVGKQAIDDDTNATGQILAGLLDWSQATFASEVKIAEDKQSMETTREVDGGLQVLSMPLPAVITTDLRLNEPRYASLPNIMKARKKPLETKELDDVAKEGGFTITPRLTTLSVEEPPVRSAGVKVADVSELFDKLKNEAKVI